MTEEDYHDINVVIIFLRQLEPLRALSKEELQESQIFIEPGDYHMTEEDYHDIDEDQITETTVEKSQLSDVIGSQSLVIKNQNKTISSLIDRVLKQDKMMHNMMEDLEYQQESTNKLMNILTSLGQQMRGPVMQYKTVMTYGLLDMQKVEYTLLFA